MTSFDTGHAGHTSYGEARRTGSLMAAGRRAIAFVGALSVAACAVDLGAPVELALFGLTLAGVAFLHRYTLQIALAGLATIVAHKLVFTSFTTADLGRHLGHEWVTLANLLLLLIGFSLLAKQFEDSNVPGALPRVLPSDWRGAFLLLAIVFVLSSFLDNIAAALIGAAMAHAVFRGKVHIGYLAAIVAAANGGGAGSVLGDTTTTMMWLEGVSPGAVVHAYVAAAAALVVSGLIGARQQTRYAPMTTEGWAPARIDWPRVSIVAFTLSVAIGANVLANLEYPELQRSYPVIGLALWSALLLTAPVRRPDWRLVPAALRGSVFLLALVVSASLMPVETLPDASWASTLGLGFLSAVFDNIPLTTLALGQGGYDWGVLAYAVGYGGSMLWFGSSAGVALTSTFPEARSAARWLAHGWHVALGYVVGFAVLLAVLGWRAPAVGPEFPAPQEPPVVTMR